MKKELRIGNLPAYLSRPDDEVKHPALIVIHEIWGLDPHIKDVTDRFAAEGYFALAPDLFHDAPFETQIDPGLMAEAANPATRDEAQKKLRAFFAPFQSPEFGQKTVAALKICLDYLMQEESCNGSVGVVGFCFGGTYSFQLAAQDKRVQAAVAFYGQPLKAEDIPHLQCPVIAFYGDQDENLMVSLPQLTEDMRKNGKAFEPVVYPGAGHAFFNDTNPNRYHPEAARDSWIKTLAFLSRNLSR